MWFRRQRQWSELAADPQTPYMIGRLLGAHEMAVVVLRSITMPPGSDAALMVEHVAEILERVGGYFVEQIPPKALTPSPDEEVTQTHP